MRALRHSAAAAALSILCTLAAFAQEAEAPGDGSAGSTVPDLLTVLRFDAAPVFGRDGNTMQWGNSSVYTLLSGNIWKGWSYTLQNHWLSSEPGPLYTDLGRSDCFSFLDVASVSYTTGGWHFKAGKDMIPFGTFEEDDYDFDVNLSWVSNFWNNVVLYQWGLQAGYTLPSENTTFTLGVASSPLSANHFSGGEMSFSLCWRGEYGPWSTIWSGNLFQGPEGRRVSTLAIGNKLTFGSFWAYFDVISSAAADVPGFFNQELTLGAAIGYDIGDKVELQAKAVRERNNSAGGIFIPDVLDLGGEPFTVFGLGANYYPLPGSRDLRLHTVLSYCNATPGLGIMVGAMYKFDMVSLFRGKAR